MSISSETARNDYTGNDNVSVYAYAFRILDQSHLEVVVQDTATPPVRTTLVITTDYTVSGVLSANGGNVTLVNSGQSWITAGGKLKTGYKLTLRRKLPLTQPTDIRNQGTFFPDTHENQFDRCVMIDQQQQDEMNRTLKLPVTEVGTAAKTTLPAEATRASKFLAFNASGEPIASDGSGTPATAAWAAVIDDTTVAAGVETIRGALTAETAPATDDEVILRDTSATTGKRMTLANLWKVINALTEWTAPVAADVMAIYDSANAATKKITLANLFKAINSLTAETTLAEADEVAIYDASAAGSRKMTVANFLKIINALTADASPDAAADYVMTYDASAGAVKKVLVTNIRTATSPTRQVLTSGTGATYTTPAGATQLRVRMVGGGGGGGAVATNAGAAGSNTIFNSIQAAGGAGGRPGGTAASGGAGGAGGTGTASFRTRGGPGGNNDSSGGYGGAGGSSMLGGGGAMPADASTGTNADANTGGGGSGASSAGTASGGGGGGEYVELIIDSPAASYTYTVGAGGNGGAAGTQAGGNGGSGVIIVDEYYN